MTQKTAGTQVQAKGTYEITGWDEKTWDGKAWNEVSGAKQTHAKVSLMYHGDLEAEATVQFLMAYPNDTSASVIGLEKVTGRIGGKSGSFILQDSGKFENGVATSTMTVVPGSGTGELAGLTGQGSSVAEHDGKLTYVIDFAFE